jgi:hypothetical protein
MTKPDENKVEIKYNNKVYEIEKTENEQKVLPKGEIKPSDNTIHPDEITVKGYKKTC